jgi:RNA polymerase sigma-70 factor (ECF subfamily)
VEYHSLPASELFQHCSDSTNAPAWDAFRARFHQLIVLTAYRTAQRWGDHSPNAVEDLVQETYVKLCAENCRVLRAFVPVDENSVFGFLKVFTANTVHDHFKALHAEKRRLLHPDRRMEQQVLLREVRECLGEKLQGPTAERDQTIFWLYYQQGFTAEAIAALPTIALSPKGVESAIFRITQVVRDYFSNRKDQPPPRRRAASHGADE